MTYVPTVPFVPDTFCSTTFSQPKTLTKDASYEAFLPAKAQALVRRIEFRYTPKHGSWLNIAENELSTMTRQCV